LETNAPHNLKLDDLDYSDKIYTLLKLICQKIVYN